MARKPPPPPIKAETLRPLPIRITQRQYQRLLAHRKIDALAIQEHIRRALDFYLDDLDEKRPRERVAPLVKAAAPTRREPPTGAPTAPTPQENPPAGMQNTTPVPPANAAKQPTKLVYR